MGFSSELFYLSECYVTTNISFSSIPHLKMWTANIFFIALCFHSYTYTLFFSTYILINKLSCLVFFFTDADQTFTVLLLQIKHARFLIYSSNLTYIW